MQKVIKKDGTKEPFDVKKIYGAVNKAAERAGVTVPLHSDVFYDLETLGREVMQWFDNDYCGTWDDGIPTAQLHKVVISTMYSLGMDKVADAYKEFRDYKNTYAKAFEKVKSDADTVLLLGDRENANFDSSLVSTKGSLIKGYLTKELYKQFYLSKEELQASKEGTVYIHDLRDMIFGSFNCCLFDMATVLKNGFEMSNVKYTEPTSVLSALQVIGDITLVATAQQFGGFTIPEIDKTLLPYAKKTYNNAFNKYFNTCNMEHDEATAMALGDLKRELEQGFQSLELKLNTVPCSRGDFAFTTLTFGTWDIMMDDLDRDIMRMIGETILEVRMKGHGGKQVVFPKLVFLYDMYKIRDDEDHKTLFDKAIECSTKCMYPDYLSLTSNMGTVSKLYKEHSVITSPMGCRAYLSPWKNPETDKYITIGRCNIGAVSLNLPLIYKKAKAEGVAFYELLDQQLELIRNFFKKRYDMIRHTKACTNPMCFTQGGLYNGTLKPDDGIGDLVKYMTASFGITALHEFVTLAQHEGLNTKRGNALAVDTIQYIKDRVDEFKEKDGYLYALYGTPAESLCGTQANQYHEYCKAHNLNDEFEGLEYFTNSFHLHVSEDITPIDKQNMEFHLFHMIEGGHIQYIRIDNPENTEAVKALVERGMHLGFYQGVNFDAAYCEDCGKHSTNVGNTCPYCGSHNLSVISRVCGYLGYSNVNGKSRMNDAKMAEIKDRKSM